MRSPKEQKTEGPDMNYNEKRFEETDDFEEIDNYDDEII